MTTEELINNRLWHYKAVVKRIYDGDTFYVDINKGFGDWKINQPIRWYGIDTPELKGEERTEGLKVKDIVQEKLLGKQIILETIKGDKSDKYGRWLGIIYLDGVNMNQWLLDNGYAVPYLES